MKVTLLILALIAVAYAAPTRKDRQFKAFIEKLLASQQQADEDTPEIEAFLEETNEQENKEKNLLSLLAQMQDDDSDEDEEAEAIIQAYFAQDQSPAQLQGWWRRTRNKIKNYLRNNKEDLIRRGISFFGR